MKVLISSRSFGRIESGAAELLEKEKLVPVFNPFGRKLTEKELINMMDDVVGIIAGTELITDKVLSKADSLKVISRYGIGMNNIDMNAASKKNILLYNTPEAPSLAVAELTVSLILALLRKINVIDSSTKQGNWNPIMGNLLTEKTVGILGLGRIGKKVVELLKPFHVNFFIYDIKPDTDFIQENKLIRTDLKTILSKSDILTIHLPLTEKTNNIIGKKELLSMKSNALLINTSRGGLVDEDALFTCLKNGNLSGAAVDCFVKEPYNGKLNQLENIILTPHIGSLTVETRNEMEIQATKNMLSGLKKVGII